ncbi:fructose-bisphosphate aldolase [Dactylosporangium vinaceum]|uniref:2-amino-3,7-dideoxy-D-threo-hept-6-ulosonate synthase n=1 Tax=Dactylosporangium vinaceum TaxID=53362 RepID=A0ABV5MED8_9ACTN|nr:2-amino-3,7-dideoxy-D-threo-hept-6-ulosonate synthase [Dactylosporangium vinaceum]UAB92427.1 fructose-bisphosphate aldolase [Dactylosporangium vinaceum]
MTTLTGKSLRLSRLSRRGDGRFLFVPLDHSVSDGPIADMRRYGRLLEEVVIGGADAIVVHKGRARVIDPNLLARCALVVHLSASTPHAPDSNAKVLVGGVEEAVQLGADAVSVHVNIGSDTEAGQLADLGRVAAGCERWGVPLLAMVYPRGPRIENPADATLLAHVVSIAADLGVDIVKTVFAAPSHRMADVVAASPIPVVVAGGKDERQSLADFATAAIGTGCAGLAIGRRVFNHAVPRRAVRELAEIVHGHPHPHTDQPELTREGVR